MRLGQSDKPYSHGTIMSFENKIALVTGGASGIGASIVRTLLAGGAVIHVLDMAYRDTARSTGENRVYKHAGDVTQLADVEQAVADIVQISGRIDILINNAGILRDNMIWKMPEKDFDDVIAVNLKGPWLMCRSVAPVMREQGYVRIVNISSYSWLGNPGQSNYSASKGGIVSLTRVMALELARYGVTVNAVAPGFIDTPMTRELPPELFEKLTQIQPGKQAGKPEDVAAAVTFFASDDAGFVSGQVLHVDGGKSIGAGVR